jgi:hypothetical protein
MKDIVTISGCDTFELSQRAFPSNFEPKLYEVWLSYIGTRTAYDLFQLGGTNKRLCMEYALRGFLSLTQSRFSRVFITNTAVDIARVSCAAAVSKYKPQADALKRFFTNKAFGQLFRMSDIQVVLAGGKNPAANAYIATTVEVYFAFLPKSSFVPTSDGVKKAKLSLMLFDNKARLFGNEIPKALEPRGTLQQKMDKNSLVDSYPIFDALVKKSRPSDWSLWFKDVNLSVARARGDVLAAKIELDPSDPIFLGRTPHSQAERQLRKEIQSLFMGVS